MATLLSIAALPAFLVLWGLSLFLRAAVMHVEAARAARKKTVGRLAPLSRAQRRAGLVGGPGVVVLGLVVVDQCFAYVGGTPLRDAVQDMEHPAWAVASTLCGALGLAGLWAGSRFDRARGRRRCAACWYDFAALPADAVCPECGRRSLGEADLARTRRSKGLIWLGAALMLVAMPVWYGWRVAMKGWRGMIPTTVMIAGLEYLPESLVSAPWVGPATRDSLTTRLYDGNMANWQRAWLVEKSQRMLRDATSLEEAARALSVTVEITPHPVLRRFTKEALDAVTETNGKRAVDGAIVLSSINEDRELDFGPELESRKSALLVVLPAGGPASYSVMRAVSLHAPATQAWMDDILGTIAAPGTGTVQQRFASTAAGGLVARNPALAAGIAQRIDDGDPEQAVEAMSVLVSAMMNLARNPDRGDVESTMMKLARHPSDTIAAMAMQPWVNSGAATIPDWLPEAVRVFLATRETERANAVYLAQQMGERGYAWAPFLLRDAADGTSGNTQSTARYAVEAARLNGALTRVSVERALAEPNLSGAHIKAMRAWLEEEAKRTAGDRK